MALVLGANLQIHYLYLYFNTIIKLVYVLVKFCFYNQFVVP